MEDTDQPLSSSLLERLQDFWTTTMPESIAELPPEWVLLGVGILLLIVGYLIVQFIFKSGVNLLSLLLAILLPFAAGAAAWILFRDYGVDYLPGLVELPAAQSIATGVAFFVVAMGISWPLLVLGWLRALLILGVTILVTIVYAHFGNQALYKHFTQEANNAEQGSQIADVWEEAEE